MIPRKRHYYLGIAALFTCAAMLMITPAFAQSSEQEPAPTSLHVLFENAALQLPDAAAAPALQAQADAQERAARGPFVGPPTVSGDIITSSTGIIEQEAGLSAGIKWPGEANAGVYAAAIGRQAAGARLNEARLLLAGDIRDAYWRLAAAQGMVAIELQHVETARIETAQAALLETAGVLARRDLLISEAELGAAMGRLSAAENDLAETLATVKALIGDAPDEFFEENLTVDRDIEAHPAYLAAQLKVNAGEAAIAFERYGTRPRLEARAGVRRERNDPRGSYENAFIVGIAIPIGRDSRAIAELEASRAELLSDRAEVTRLRRILDAEYHSALTRLTIAERALGEAETRRAALREALTLTELGRNEGEIGYIEYLRARQALFDAERDLTAAHFAKSAAISNVNQAMGILP